MDLTGHQGQLRSMLQRAQMSGERGEEPNYTSNRHEITFLAVYWQSSQCSLRNDLLLSFALHCSKCIPKSNSYYNCSISKQKTKLLTAFSSIYICKTTLQALLENIYYYCLIAEDDLCRNFWCVLCNVCFSSVKLSAHSPLIWLVIVTILSFCFWLPQNRTGQNSGFIPR